MNVLVIDDSAVVRQVLSAVLAQRGGMSVTIAADPVIGLQKLRARRPDVILLDLEMPRMDGLTFLRRIMAEDPIPVVVCSGLSGGRQSEAIRALEEGAVEVVVKPSLGVRDFLEDSAARLIETLRNASRARLPVRAPARADPVVAPVAPVAPAGIASAHPRVVAIGASMGGPDALRRILEAMPPDSPGMVIVQHMPERFIRAFARRLDQSCPIEVKEAADGDEVRPGRALIAPGDEHLVVRRAGERYVVGVAAGPLVSRHRPSVDVLFASVARAAGADAVGVILTGMGVDGAAGLAEMAAAGAATIAQDEASCVVFGMPGEAIRRGAVQEVAALDAIPRLILRKAREPVRRR